LADGRDDLGVEPTAVLMVIEATRIAVKNSIGAW
jgi:hypothetical protein